jgi:hypothetical protein
MPKRDADLPAMEPRNDQETVGPNKSFEFELEEALHMAFTLYFFAIGRVKGYNDWESDKREIFEGGLEGLFKVMEQYDEHFQSPPSERFCWQPTLSTAIEELAARTRQRLDIERTPTGWRIAHPDLPGE